MQNTSSLFVKSALAASFAFVIFMLKMPQPVPKLTVLI